MDGSHPTLQVMYRPRFLDTTGASSEQGPGRAGFAGGSSLVRETAYQASFSDSQRSSAIASGGSQSLSERLLVVLPLSMTGLGVGSPAHPIPVPRLPLLESYGIFWTVLILFNRVFYVD